jgi:uncharacterized protein (DUF4213/DUF364 family)
MVTGKGNPNALAAAKAEFERISEEHHLLGADVTVLVKTLTPEEAIGTPGRRDFPIVVGKERVVEAEFRGAKAHAFTDVPKEFVGKLQEVIAMPLADSGVRAVFIATMNAVLKHLGIIQTTLHCKDEEPEKCAREIALQIMERWGAKTVGLIGLNPAVLEALSGTFGAENIRTTDLNRQNIGSLRYGVQIWDGTTMTERLAMESDLVLLTGTTLVNGTFEGIWKAIRHYNKNYLIYGVTSAGTCELTGLRRICPYGRS